MSTTLISTTLFIHALSGFMALLTGAIAIVTKKGSDVHNKSGIVYFYAMMSVVITGFVVAIAEDNSFLTYVGCFTLYLTYSGYRSIQNKALKPNIPDWIIWGIGTLNGVAMVSTFNIILFVFGILSLVNIVVDIRLFIKAIKGKSLPKLSWLRRHVGMMLGAYIATFTASLVVNIQYEAIPWLPWLMPTFVLTPVIIYWTRQVKYGKLDIWG